MTTLFPRSDSRGARTSGRRRARRRLSCEQLERRELLRGAELSWADTSQLTLSFAADGTEIVDEPSRLFELFGSFARPTEWQQVILQGFQTWLQHTGSNIGVVPDVGGLPFGTPGPRTGDPRFGDIRIGARPLTPDVMAISVAHDTVVSGTWGGDVIFNSDAEFRSLDELFAVAVHESGHVFGLEHSDDPESPMYTHGAPVHTAPTAEDIEGVQRLQGKRVADQNEGPHGNDTPRTATPLQLSLTPDLGIAAATHLVYGDITAPDDVDVFSLSVPPRVTGPIKVRLQSRRISLLAPALRVLTVDGVEVAKTESQRVGGATLEIVIDDVSAGATYLIEVRAAQGTSFDVGGYSLITTFEGQVIVPVPDDLVESLSVARQRDFTQRDIQALLADRKYLLDSRENLVDSILTAVNLPPEQGFELYSRYEAYGAITSDRDVDYYYFTAAQTDRGQPYAHLTVRPLELASLIPEANVLDRLGNPIPTQVLVNGGGELVLQAAVKPGEQYYIRVRAESQQGLFDRGNYRVSLNFVETPIEPVTFAQGRLRTGTTDSPTIVRRIDTPRAAEDAQDAEQAERAEEAEHGYSLYVALPQLFHFILQAGPAGTNKRELVLASLFDQQDRLVYRLSARPGEIRTNNSVLLLPGTYRLRFDPIAWGDVPAGRLNFRLQGLSISDPFAIDPYDPTYDPFFECPEEEDLYCYPGGIISEDPFLWDEFLDSLPEIPELTLPELVTELLGSWWSWYWDQQGVTLPPLAVDDGYLVSSDSTLVVDAQSGVLANDVLDAGARPEVILIDDVDHGVLDLEADGSFRYVPPTGFAGTVEFQYQVFDSVYHSPTATVTIRVLAGNAVPGDFDDNQLVDVEDVNLLCEAIRFEIPNPIFDLNSDGFINHTDWDLLLTNILGTTPGDANLDRLFNSADLVEVFVANEYEDQLTTNSTWDTGDWDCDGEFTSSDLIVAFMAGSYTAESAPVAAQARPQARAETSFRYDADLAARLAADRGDDDRPRRL